MNNVTIILIVLAFILIYNLLLHLVDRKLLIRKIDSLENIFKFLIHNSDVVDDKKQLLNFLVTVEKDINDIV